MRIILLIIILGGLITTVGYEKAFALDLDVNLIPNRIIENSEGVLEIFAIQNGKVFPTKLNNLKVVSSDVTIFEIVSIQNNDDSFIHQVKIKTNKPGTAIIGIAATGFSSVEFPIKVYETKQSQQQLVVKITPNTFDINSEKKGYVLVELADVDGFPVNAKEHTIVSLHASVPDSVKLLDEELIIKKGEYFALTEFEIVSDGEVSIYATSEDMVSDSDIIVVEEEEDLSISLFVFPETINTYKSSQGHVIAQLQNNSTGKPVIANKNIPVYLKVKPTDFEPFNIGNQVVNEINTVGYFQIDKGSYWGHTTITTLPGIEDFFDVTVSTADPLSITTTTIQAINLELFDDQDVKFLGLPVLATGKRELIGVVFLEDANEHPVIADKDVFIDMESSDEDFLTVDDVTIRDGTTSSLVFGQVGTSIPEETIFVLPAVEEGNTNMTSIEVFGPERELLELVAEPLVPDILTNTNFPIAVYLEDEDGHPTVFPKNSDLFISPSKSVQVESTRVSKGDYIVILDAKSLQGESDILDFEVGEYKTTLFVESSSLKLLHIEMIPPKSILVGYENSFSLQILGNNDNPVFVEKDIEIQLVAKDPSIVRVPSSIIVEEGSYYLSFNVESQKVGSTEITAISNDFLISKIKVTTEKLVPELSISVPETLEQGETFIPILSVKYNDNPLNGINVNWSVNGALIQNEDTNTNSAGEATIALLTQTNETVNILVQVSDPYFSSQSIKQSISVNASLPTEPVEPEYTQFKINGFDPILIAIPGAIVAAGYVMKRKGMMTLKKK